MLRIADYFARGVSRASRRRRATRAGTLVRAAVIGCAVFGCVGGANFADFAGFVGFDGAVDGGFGVRTARAQLAYRDADANGRDSNDSRSSKRTPIFSGKLARGLADKFGGAQSSPARQSAQALKNERSAQNAQYAQTAQTASGARNAQYSQSGRTAQTARRVQYPQTAQTTQAGRSAQYAQYPQTAPSAQYSQSARRAQSVQTTRSAGSAAAKSGGFLSADYSRSSSEPSATGELARASTSRESANEVLAKIPWNALSPAARAKFRELTANPTIYRRLPMAGGYCNPELFDYLLLHPQTIVSLWRDMGYEDLSMERTGANKYVVREKGGTVGYAQIVYQDDELTLAYCSGSYRGPIAARSFDGEIAAVLQTRYAEDASGKPIVVCRMDAFVELKNPGADLLGRTFGGALGKIADANFSQTLAFVDSVSQTAERDPEGFVATVARLEALSPDEKRTLAATTAEIARQARLRETGVLVDYRLAPKPNKPGESVARILSRGDAGVVAGVGTSGTSGGSGAIGTSRTIGALDDARAGSTFARAGSTTVGGTPGTILAAPSSARSGAASGTTFGRTTAAPGAFDGFDPSFLGDDGESFALSDSDDEYDFETEIDWGDAEIETSVDVESDATDAPRELNATRLPSPKSIPLPSAARAPFGSSATRGSFGAATKVPSTSTAKATARPSGRASKALELLDDDEESDASPALPVVGTLSTDGDDEGELIDDAPETFAIDDEATDDEATDDAEETEIALPFALAEPLAATTDATAEPLDDASAAEPEPLAPTLLLPDFAEAEPVDDAETAPTVAEAEPIDDAETAPTVDDGGGWTPVVPNARVANAPTPRATSEVAPRVRVEKTASAPPKSADDPRGATFRKPALK